MRDELVQCRDGHRPQALALDPQPILERLLLQAEAVEQVAAIDDKRLFEIFRRRVGGQRLEPRDIEIEIIEIEGDAMAIRQEPAAVGCVHRFLYGGQGLPEVHPRLGLAVAAPQQRGELLA